MSFTTATSTEHGESALYLTLENTPLGYQLHCGNLMDDDASMLGQRIGELNNFNHAQLRKALRRCLVRRRTGQHPQFGNAGLGLIRHRQARPRPH